MNVMLDEVRHRKEMGLGQIASDAERAAHVLAMDQDMQKASDRPSYRTGIAVGRGPPQGLQYDRWVLLTAYEPISCHPAVVPDAMPKHSPDNRANSEGTLRACGHVSENVPDAPRGTQ